jgi:hypothetical protein
MKKKKFRSYRDAKRILRRLRLKNLPDWKSTFLSEFVYSTLR